MAEEQCKSNPDGLRQVEESEHGGLVGRDKIAGPQSAGPVATGKFGSDSEGRKSGGSRKVNRDRSTNGKR